MAVGTGKGEKSPRQGGRLHALLGGSGKEAQSEFVLIIKS
jgi:hypothetical protein